MKRRIVCKCVACNKPFIQRYWVGKNTIRKTCGTRCSAVFKEVYTSLKENMNKDIEVILNRKNVVGYDKQKIINVYNYIKSPEFQNLKFEYYDEIKKGESDENKRKG